MGLFAVLGVVLVGITVGRDGDADSGAPSAVPPGSSSTPAGPTSSPGQTGDGGTVGEGKPTSSPQPTESPSSPSATPDSGKQGSFTQELLAFRERCLRETTSLDAAAVFYETPVRLAKARPHRFNLEIRPVTQAGATPSGPLRKHGQILLACTVQARLLGVPDALQVAPATWQGRRFLPPSPSRWTWVVTAETDGRTDTVLQLKPVVQIVDGDRIEVRGLGVAEYDVTFSAPAPPAPTVPLLERVGDFLASSWKALVALATGVSAILAALVAVRGLRSRNASPGDPPSTAPEGRSTVASGAPSDSEDHRDA